MAVQKWNVTVLALLIASAGVLLSTILQKWLESPLQMHQQRIPILNSFTYVPGFFQHDAQPTGPEEGFRAVTLPKFGLLERDYESDRPSEAVKTSWERFEHHIHFLNSQSPTDRYKVLFIARHGEATNNFKEREVGRHEWKRYWSRLEGDGTLTWHDAHLTPKGITQAEEAGDFWANAVSADKVPVPEKWFTSPLTRCLHTTETMRKRVQMTIPLSSPPFLSEAVREISGVHTCDKRSTRSAIEAAFPEFILEGSMSEEDNLWHANKRNTPEEHVKMWRTFLEQLFVDNSTFIFIATHSGATRALYLAIGHPDVWTAAGSIVPILVRGQSAAV